MRQPWFASTMISRSPAHRLAHRLDHRQVDAPVVRVEAKLDRLHACVAECEAASNAFVRPIRAHRSRRRRGVRSCARRRGGARAARRASGRRGPRPRPPGSSCGHGGSRRSRRSRARPHAAADRPRRGAAPAARGRGARRRSHTPRRRRPSERSPASHPDEHAAPDPMRPRTAGRADSGSRRVSIAAMRIHSPE